MSGVIKSHVMTDTVRPLRLRERGDQLPVAPLDAERVRLEAELVGMEALLRARDGEIEDLKRRLVEETKAAEARGHAGGLEAAERKGAERMAALSRTVGAAGAELSAVLASLERLAPLLARAGLEKIVGNADFAGDLLHGAVLTAVRQIESESLVRVEVARDDYPDLAPLREALAAAAGRPVEVRHAADLRGGDCRLRLRLGELEVGVNQQWERLSALLVSLSEPEASR